MYTRFNEFELYGRTLRRTLLAKAAYPNDSRAMSDLPIIDLMDMLTGDVPVARGLEPLAKARPGRSR